MGEVYRARDTRLNRDVAIKILPDLFAADAERVSRFQREAQLLASLNHPNIAHIHGLEDTGTSKALVLELVDGPTLADLISKGPIPVEDALPIAKQIAEALEAAHEHGVIHRDLKPANIKLTADGTVKVLDFGLAKAAETSNVGRNFSAAGSTGQDPAYVLSQSPTYVLSQSPTITSPAMTLGGVILGTAAYMSPEQAKGKTVDKRTDIWAYGCVLFEMLTGKRAFEGDDVSDTLVAILRDQPDWSAVGAGVPAAVQTLLRRCLEKDTKLRLRDIGEARIVLGKVDGSAETISARSLQLRSATVAAAMLAGVVMGVGAMWIVPERVVERDVPVQRFSIRLPATTRLSAPLATFPLAVSRDGAQLLYLVETLGPRVLHLRRFNQAGDEMVRGSEGAARPFFSPDGRRAGFIQRGRLMKTDLSGGTPVDLGVTVNGGGTWTDRDEIIYSAVPAGGGESRLFVLPSNGGKPRQLPSRPNDPVYSQPHALPGGEAVLFTISADLQRRSVAVMSLDSGEIRIVDEAGEFPHFVSSGHMVFLRAGGTLMARPFDVRQLAAAGPAVPVAEVQQALFSVSHSGLFVYVAADGTAPTTSRLAWVDRSGRSVPIPSEPEAYAYPRITRDGERAVVGIGFGTGVGDISIIDLKRGSRIPLTHGDRVKGGNLSAIAAWSHDERHVTFSSSASPDEYRLEQITTDGTGQRDVLFSIKGKLVQPGSWSHDGRKHVFYTGSSFGTGSDRDIHYLDLDRRATTTDSLPLVVTRSREVAPRLSPDSKWVAFVSDMSGRQEVYVTKFPERTHLQPVSSAGGTEPVWSRNGRELFYRNGSAMMSVSFADGPKPILGQPLKLFDSRHRHDPSVSGAVPNYDVGADGRFLMVEGPSDADGVDLSVVVNWAEELKRVAPAR
jgi:Tol biopolymer transport system component